MDKRNHEPLGPAFARYGVLLRHRHVLGYAGAGASSTSACSPISQAWSRWLNRVFVLPRVRIP